MSSCAHSYVAVTGGLARCACGQYADDLRFANDELIRLSAALRASEEARKAAEAQRDSNDRVIDAWDAQTEQIVAEAEARGAARQREADMETRHCVDGEGSAMETLAAQPLVTSAREAVSMSRLPSGKDIIAAIRGGEPDTCDYCGRVVGYAMLVPEESSTWVCRDCLARWEADEAARAADGWPTTKGSRA